jgi:hypothetical protein
VQVFANNEKRVVPGIDQSKVNEQGTEP